MIQLPNKIKLIKRPPPAPDDFYSTWCICDSMGRFIKELPASKLYRNEQMLMLGYIYTGHKAGEYNYSLAPKWEIQPTEQEAHLENQATLF